MTVVEKRDHSDHHGKILSFKTGSAKDVTLPSLANALQALSVAVLENTDSVASIAVDLIRSATCAKDLLVLKRMPDSWIPQNIGGPDAANQLLAAMPELLDDDSRVLTGEYGCFIPLAPGHEGIFLPGFSASGAQVEAFAALANAFILASAAANRGRAVLDALDEISGLQSVARETLSARELAQVLACATHETLRLLSANICGVFLREGDEVVMKSCVGNLRIETSQLRMKRGRGVAGRVFETGQACRIDEYVRDHSISQDYVELAKLEHAYSALAAPLKIRGEVVGVLEVWRRRKSTFSDRDVRRIVALANLTAIAIENARLNEAQQISVQQLAAANLRLQEQNNAVGLFSEIQQAMLQALLSGDGLDGIARVVERYVRADVAILTSDLEPMTASPVNPVIEAVFPTIKILLLEQYKLGQNRCISTGASWVRLQPILVSGESVGWLCIVTPSAPNDICDMALSAGAIASALSYLENQAAMQARADVGGEILLDLLEGAPKVRRSAIARAKGMRIDLLGSHRVLHCSLEQLDELGHAEGWSASTAEQHRRLVIDSCSRGLESCGLKLFTIRGNLIVALVAGKNIEEFRRALTSVDESLTLKIPGFRPKWGVSSISGTAGDYKTAHREAAIALLAATKFGATRIAISEELGVLGLLLSVRHDGDLTGLVGSILGDVIEHDLKHHRVLARTLRTYFDVDCSLQATAARLHIHQKTVRYRLTQFETLSGMDLRRHDNRMMVDLALRMHVIQNELPPDQGGSPSTDAIPH